MNARNGIFHHKSPDHFEPELKAYVKHKGFHSYAYVAAVGREQQMIDSRGGPNGANSTNGRREVAADNELGPMYWNTSNDAFGFLFPYTGTPNPPPPEQNVVWPRSGIIPALEGPIIKIAPPLPLLPE